MQSRNLRNALHLVVATGLTAQAAMAQPATSEGYDRTVLPIRLPRPAPIEQMDVRDATQPPPTSEIKAPKGAPNVIVVLIDDLGFGATGTFGGPIPTPTLERLANGGLRYNNFHTTALCSPTRTALKSGRNHHTNNMAFVTEMATAFPGPPVRSRMRSRPWRRCCA